MEFAKIMILVIFLFLGASNAIDDLDDEDGDVFPAQEAILDVMENGDWQGDQTSSESNIQAYDNTDDVEVNTYGEINTYDDTDSSDLTDDSIEKFSAYESILEVMKYDEGVKQADIESTLLPTQNDTFTAQTAILKLLEDDKWEIKDAHFETTIPPIKLRPNLQKKGSKVVRGGSYFKSNVEAISLSDNRKKSHGMNKSDLDKSSDDGVDTLQVHAGAILNLLESGAW